MPRRTALLALVGLLLALPARAQLAGTYTVGGASPDFASPAAAAAELNAQGVGGKVTFSIRPGSYEGFSIGAVAGASPTRTVVFTASDPANPPLLKHAGATSATNYVVRLDGTTDVSFTGLRFEATAGGGNGRLIEIRGASAARLGIKNCTLVGLPGATTDAASLVTVATPEMPGLAVTGSTFTQGYIGLDLSEDVHGLTVEHNLFNGQDAFGARLRGNGVVSGNEVNDGPTSRFAYVGLAVSSALEGFEVLGNTVVVKRGTTGLSAPGAAAVVNNTVAMSSPSGLRGLLAGGTLVAHNTVRTTLNAHALETSGSIPTTLYGNLLLSIGNGAALRVTGTVAASDHNNLYSAGASVVSQGATGYATLAAWQAASGLDGASVSRTVSFVSIGVTPDLHLAGASLTDPFLIAGTIAEVPRDRDNQLRDSYNAKMGADEGTPLPPLDNADSANGEYYTVATTIPDFADPQAFFDHLAKRRMKGRVSAIIIAGTFPLQATLPADLRVGAAAANPAAARLTVSGDNPSIPTTLTATGVTAATNWVLRLNGLDFVTLFHLNFQAAAGDYGTLLRLDLGPDGEGVDNLEVTGCTFDGAIGGIGGGTRALVFAAQGPHHRGRYTANTFLDGSMGVLYEGAPTAVPADQSFDVFIDANTFTGQIQRGVHGTFSRPVVVDNVFTGGSGTTAMGIGLEYSVGYTILRNQIAYTSSSADGIRLKGTSVTSGSPGLIANNLIRAGRPVWMYIGAAGGRIVHNTLYAVGSGSSPVQTSSSGNSIADLSGNLLIHSAGGLALDIGQYSTISASNGNVFWSTGPTLLRYGGTDHATLGAYQAATGFDAASRVFLPTFVNATTDLHLAPSMDGDAHLAVPPVVGITTDADGQSRGTAFAYAGADELSLLAPLAGLYTVGAQSGQPPPAFDTLTEALFTVETLGVAAPTTLALAPTPLVGPFTVRPFPGAGGLNRLTITGSPTLIHNPGTSAADNAALFVDGADHVTLSGLTLQGTLGSAGFGRALVLSGDVEDVVVDNVEFRGRLGSASDQAALVYGSGTTTTDLTIQNSVFLHGSFGVFLTASLSEHATGTFLGNLTMTDFTGIGILLSYHDEPLLNDVVVTSATATGWGIQIMAGTGATVARTRVAMTAPSGRGLRFSSQSGTPAAPVRVENSFLTSSGSALLAVSGDHLRVVHTSMLTSGISETFLRSGGTGHVYRNNVIVNTGAQPVLRTGSPTTVVAESDHNVLRTTGPTFAMIDGVDYPTLAAYQSGTGLDGASVNVPVTFANASTGDLHLAGASIGAAALAAPPLPDVPRDFDNVLRSTTAVYRGADENAAPLTPQVMIAIAMWLQGADEGNRMRTSLAGADAIPLTQPYANPAFNGTALDYDGTESVPAGFFSANPTFVDWVLVGLRSDPNGPDVARRALLLNEVGSVRAGATDTILSFAVLPGSYHVVVYHRNHLALMSTALLLSGTTTQVSLDVAAGVYGGAAAGVVLPSGILALAAGDGDASGSVLAPDRQSVWLPQVGQAGYLAGDFNLDGSVLADDRQALLLPNVGRTTSVPGEAQLVVEAE